MTPCWPVSHLVVALAFLVASGALLALGPTGPWPHHGQTVVDNARRMRVREALRRVPVDVPSDWIARQYSFFDAKRGENMREAKA